MARDVLSSVQPYAMYWVIIASATGSVISAISKATQICKEPDPVYKNETIEKPMRGVYHTTRIAAHGGLGAFIGGFTALTAPVSIPLYMYWRRDMDQQNDTR